MQPIVAIIVAIGPGRVIGRENQMPWHLPRDLRFFRRVTTGHAIIMGRRTFESLGKRPLPKRRNIVISRNPQYVAQGCEVVHSLEEGVTLTRDNQRLFVIGGGQLYAAALPIADEIYLTEIFDESPNLNLFEPFPGDIFFPELDPTQWKLVRLGKRRFIAANRLVPIPIGNLRRKGLYFRFQVYSRLHPARPNNV